MAAEVIALLHGLLSAPETHTAQSWSEAVQRVSKNWLLSEELSLAHIELCGIISICGLNFMVNYFPWSNIHNEVWKKILIWSSHIEGTSQN